MILVTIHSFEAAAKDYGAATATHSAPDLGAVMKLFSGSGDSGMAFQYVVSDKDSGEPMVTYYADSDDLVSGLPAD